MVCAINPDEFYWQFLLVNIFAVVFEGGRGVWVGGAIHHDAAQVAAQTREVLLRSLFARR